MIDTDEDGNEEVVVIGHIDDSSKQSLEEVASNFDEDCDDDKDLSDKFDEDINFNILSPTIASAIKSSTKNVVLR